MPQAKQLPKASEIAKRIADLYNLAFGRGKKTHLRIERDDMDRLTGRKRLEESVQKKVAGKLGHKGLLLTNLGGNFMVLSKESFEGWRQPTSEHLAEVLPPPPPKRAAPAKRTAKVISRKTPRPRKPPAGN